MSVEDPSLLNSSMYVYNTYWSTEINNLLTLQDIGVHLQEVGREYGTTTGRRRRCGWLDLLVLRHSSMINGYDSLNLTKLDVLDQLPEIKIATRYLVDGKELEGFPGQPLSSLPQILSADIFLFHAADLELLANVDVEYVTLPGWQSSIENITSYDDLPENCKGYIKFVEDSLNVPIEWIGVGPARKSMVRKELKQ